MIEKEATPRLVSQVRSAFIPLSLLTTHGKEFRHEQH